MENTFERIKSLLYKVENYGKTSFELYKHKLIKSSAEVLSTFIFRGVLLIVLFMTLLFASIGASFWLGDLMDKIYLGFLSVAVFYMVLVAVCFFLVRHYLKRKISSSIISEIFKKESQNGSTNE
ncbi:MAG: phage holin family protein [Bacteroidota bacterium]